MYLEGRLASNISDAPIENKKEHLVNNEATKNSIVKKIQSQKPKTQSN